MKLSFTLQRLVLAVILAGICCLDTMAQQEAMYSQYMFNTLAINPAYAGSRDVLSMTALYRKQWVGIDGAPSTQTFTADMPLNKERIGLGLQAFNDEIGIFKNTGAYFSYAFRVKIAQRTTLALGLQAGATNLRADYLSVNTGPTADNAFSQNISKWLPNFGTGIFISNDRAYIGLSVPQLIRGRLNDFSKSDSARQERHYFVMAGFVVKLSNSIHLKPSMLLKAVQGAPVAFDGNVNIWFRNRIALGASFRTGNVKFNNSPISGGKLGDAVVGLLEVQLSDQIRFGYAYDYMLNDLKKESHEIMLRYEFGFTKSRILTPRYF
ncbi:MAG: type IX secretion system membrane protein PorP/SprF [Spirosomataceae bacterium]